MRSQEVFRNGRSEFLVEKADEVKERHDEEVSRRMGALDMGTQHNFCLSIRLHVRYVLSSCRKDSLCDCCSPSTDAIVPFIVS